MIRMAMAVLFSPPFEAATHTFCIYHFGGDIARRVPVWYRSVRRVLRALARNTNLREAR